MNMKRDFSLWVECYEEVSGQAPRTAKEAEDYFVAAMLYIVRKEIDIVTPGLREAEERLISRGMAKMYFGALRDVLEIEEGMSETEELLALIHATPEDRSNAVAIAMNMYNDQEEFFDYLEPVQ